MTPSVSTDDSKQVGFSLEQNTRGFPAVVTPQFTSAIQATKGGGQATFDYFDALNRTSDFWGKIADQTINFIPATDPSGTPVVIASSGNVNLRVAAGYTSQTENPPLNVSVGTAIVETTNTTTSVSQLMALGVRLATMPAYLPLSAKLFSQLLVPIYKNVQGFLTRTATTVQQGAQVENPQIDAEEQAGDVVEEQSGVVEELDESIAEEGLDTMTIDWLSAGVAAAGLLPLAALPMVFEHLGHQMYHAVIVQNLTDLEFEWSIPYQASGSVAVEPASSIAAQQTFSDPVRGSQTTLSYQANFQFINSSDLGSIGYVLTLTPSSGGTPANVVVSIPWEGQNAIWVGPSRVLPHDLYRSKSTVNGNLTQAAAFGDYLVTVSINALSGKTANDTYYYCSTVVIEPAG